MDRAEGGKDEETTGNHLRKHQSMVNCVCVCERERLTFLLAVAVVSSWSVVCVSVCVQLLQVLLPGEGVQVSQ